MSYCDVVNKKNEKKWENRQLMFNRQAGEQNEATTIAAIMKAMAGEEYVFTTIQLDKGQ